MSTDNHINGAADSATEELLSVLSEVIEKPSSPTPAMEQTRSDLSRLADYMDGKASVSTYVQHNTAYNHERGVWEYDGSMSLQITEYEIGEDGRSSERIGRMTIILPVGSQISWEAGTRTVKI